MKIRVNHLGAIKNADIDLDKSFLLFCGQNNTGKTYLSFVIYAITKFKIIREKIFSIDIPDLISNGYCEVEIDAKRIFDYKKKTISELKNNLDTVFGISDEQAEQLFENFNVSFINDAQQSNDKVASISFRTSLELKDIKIHVTKNEGENKIKLELIEGEDYANLLKDEYAAIFINSVIANLISLYPINRAIIFPVERNSIYTFSKELSINRNLLIDQMQKLSKGAKLNPFEFISNSSNRYPLAIKDGLSVSDDLENIQKKRSNVYEMAVKLEESLLNGKLSVTKEGDLQFTSNKRKGRKLPIHMTASIVKTLSSLIFYLKYQASEGDLIIIDEPEMNLHPDNQILLARVFAKLHNNGFRLIISTHSDYIIREINNLIMSSHESQIVRQVANKIGYTDDFKINPKSVGCYYFHFQHSSSRQVMVKEIEISEDGIEIESIDNEINDQNERMQELYYALNNIEEK